MQGSFDIVREIDIDASPELVFPVNARRSHPVPPFFRPCTWEACPLGYMGSLITMYP